MLKARFRTIKILWAALSFSTVLFFGMTFVVKPQPNPDLPPFFPLILAAAALGSAVASFVVPQLQLKAGLRNMKLALKEEADPTASDVLPSSAAPRRKVFADPNIALSQSVMLYQTNLILALALSEAVALFGFVLAFMGQPLVVYLPFFVVCWALMALRFPTPERAIGPVERAHGAHLSIAGR